MFDENNIILKAAVISDVHISYTEYAVDEIVDKLNGYASAIADLYDISGGDLDAIMMCGDYSSIGNAEQARTFAQGTRVIFDEIFKDKPEEFEKTFGFPMYKNGDLNFDELFIDLYSSEYDVTNGDGTDQYDQEIIMEQYCKKHNIPVDVKPNVNVTPENFEKISKKGQISILAYDHYELYNPKTGKTKTLSAGHSMSVIGTTEDNRYIVSSWGEKYYLQIDNDTRYTFVQIQYKEV